MSVRSNPFANVTDAVSGIDELVLFCLVIVLFSAGLAANAAVSDMARNTGELDDLNKQAIAIMNKLTAHDSLIYDSAPGVFDARKLAELTERDIVEIVTIPAGFCLRVNITDISGSGGHLCFEWSVPSPERPDIELIESAVADTPVNIRIGVYEVRAAILTVTLWR